MGLLMQSRGEGHQRASFGDARLHQSTPSLISLTHVGHVAGTERPLISTPNLLAPLSYYHMQWAKLQISILNLPLHFIPPEGDPTIHSGTGWCNTKF